MLPPMNPRCSRCIALCCLLTALNGIGCGGEEVVLDLRGHACLSPDGTWPTGPQSFRAEVEPEVMVLFHSCLSSECDVDRVAECSALVTDGRLEITARGRYTDERGPGSACTSGCGRLEATCPIVGLDEGDYTVTYGSESIDWSFPSVTGVYCVDLSM